MEEKIYESRPEIFEMDYSDFDNITIRGVHYSKLERERKRIKELYEWYHEYCNRKSDRDDTGQFGNFNPNIENIENNLLASQINNSLKNL